MKKESSIPFAIATLLVVGAISGIYLTQFFIRESCKTPPIDDSTRSGKCNTSGLLQNYSRESIEIISADIDFICLAAALVAGNLFKSKAKNNEQENSERRCNAKIKCAISLLLLGLAASGGLQVLIYYCIVAKKIPSFCGNNSGTLSADIKWPDIFIVGHAIILAVFIATGCTLPRLFTCTAKKAKNKFAQNNENTNKRDRKCFLKFIVNTKGNNLDDPFFQSMSQI